MKVRELVEKLKDVDQDAIVFSTDSEFGDSYEAEMDSEVENIHLQGHEILQCTGENCYYCKRNAKSPQNYRKATGLRIV